MEDLNDNHVWMIKTTKYEAYCVNEGDFSEIVAKTWHEMGQGFECVFN